ncbi:putative E3 ubiquitin-protein ligase XBAT34 isoform X2 [Phoenix dactylifera]|uniref:E3 ubiquitin-protein ligase XBAT34 isoform X2 n=1 Tax=Phoenix dactylifera TaxID=42345 RepID=A0A8B7CM46_PHODC|nr:putative E3 ubiquitin-protein ligase XBAT34 isoform X2 [Phoenix dactylifera]
MGAQQSKDELLYQQVNHGNIEGIRALRHQGAGLEWMDKKGKTPLILACMRLDLLHVAKALIEMGANVNAYRHGGHAGTPLHHAAKKGLEQTVHLLLSHGANPFIMNDDCHSALDLAREKGHYNVVRAIESQICLFSGWLREHYGPSFLEAFAPKLMSRKIWAVVLPCDSHNPTKPLKFELAIYPERQERIQLSDWRGARLPKRVRVRKHLGSNCNNKIPGRFQSKCRTLDKRLQLPRVAENDRRELRVHSTFYHQVAKPRIIISLWKAHIEEPKFNQPDPALVIMDKATRTRYKFLSANEGDKQQLQWFYNACRGIPQVINNIPVTPAGGPVPPPSQINSYASATSTVTHTSNQEDTELAMAINASIQSAIVEGVPNVQPVTRTSNTNGWGSSSSNSTNNGWGPPDTAPPSTLNAQAHLNESNTSVYNGWAAPEVGPNNSASQPATSQSDTPFDIPSQDAHPTVLVPSAPPVTDETFYDGPIHYPSIDSSPVDISMPAIEIKPVTNEVKEDTASTPRFSKPGNDEVKEGSSSTSGSCVICLDAPVDGACIPCGHMIGCMPCLKEIKAKNWGCPVCRANVDQVIKLYAV